MRINKLDNVFQVYNKNSTAKKTKGKQISEGSDEVKISEKAIDFQFAVKKLKDVEEIRMEKVKNIKNQIKSGTYEVNSNMVAEKILEDISFNKKI
ncbi:MAG: flagellar biosynthesis anti-sigma factor FlgM [Tissierellaceae bacterium]|nr:flagellar biosynthesis anti-sigma factor FlgM [Tissierellaceae bacterium]